MWLEKLTRIHIAGCGALPVIVAQNKCDMPMHADVPGQDAMIQWAAANGKLSERGMPGAGVFCLRQRHRDFHPGVIGSVETSAKDHTHAGIAEAVAVLVHSIISKGHVPEAATTQGVVNPQAQTGRTKGCC
jgi:hypothetical protein